MHFMASIPLPISPPLNWSEYTNVAKIPSPVHRVLADILCFLNLIHQLMRFYVQLNISLKCSY